MESAGIPEPQPLADRRHGQPLANQLRGQLATYLRHQRAETGALFLQASVERGATDVQRLAGRLDAHAFGQACENQATHRAGKRICVLQLRECRPCTRLQHLSQVVAGAENGMLQEVARQVEAVSLAVEAQLAAEQLDIVRMVGRGWESELAGQRPQL
ncbi:hypothetical protein D3C73_1353980 [compost metagenome]